jgi:hypothetical protein
MPCKAPYTAYVTMAVQSQKARVDMHVPHRAYMRIIEGTSSRNNGNIGLYAFVRIHPPEVTYRQVPPVSLFGSHPEALPPRCTS